MVGRSKPQKNMDRRSSEDHVAAEIMMLKSKNSELAKALADAKLSMKQTLDERDYLQRQLFTMQIRNSELVKYIRLIDEAARKSINALVQSSNYITEIAEITMASIRKSDTLPTSSVHNSSVNPSSSCPSSPTSKRQYVKPMIDGHVIHRPTISLRRVNEIPLEEIRLLRTTPPTHTHNNSMNSLSPDPNEITENSPFARISTNTSRPRSFIDCSSHTPLEDDINNEDDEEFMNEASNSSDSELADHNRLPTIEELSEGIDNSVHLDDDLSTVANASNTSSVHIPGRASQGPLLSGVFRDVRVYLSPMQNVAQYLESLRGVTTERGKTYKTPKKAKRHYSPRTVSFDENNQCVVTIKASASCSDQNNSSLHSTFDDPASSVLTSTRVSNNFDESCRNHKPEYTSTPCWSNSFKKTATNKNVHKFNNNNSSENGCTKSKIWIPLNDISSKEQNYSSCHTSGMTSPAYDPLEGPSTLLDSNTSSINEKLQTMSMLGLTLKSSLDVSPSTPSTPATAVLKRRERDQTITPGMTNRNLFITHRKLDTKKSVIATKIVTKSKRISTLKCSVKRDSTSPLKNSPRKRDTTNTVKQKVTKNQKKKRLANPSSKIKKEKISKDVSVKSENISNEMVIKEELTLLSQNSSATSVSVSSSIATRDSIKSNRRKRKQSNSGLSDGRRHSKSPQKSPRKKRLASNKLQSLREPSLMKKLRRS